MELLEMPGKFKQGIDFAGQEELIKKAFSLKKASCVAITVNSPGGSPVQSHMIYNFIRQQANNTKKKVIVFAEDVAGIRWIFNFMRWG
jgi:ClpP class serine protease